MSTKRVTIQYKDQTAYYEDGKWICANKRTQSYLRSIDFDKQGTFIFGSEPCPDQAVAKAMCELIEAKIIKVEGVVIESVPGRIY